MRNLHLYRFDNPRDMKAQLARVRSRLIGAIGDHAKPIMLRRVHTQNPDARSISKQEIEGMSARTAARAPAQLDPLADPRLDWRFLERYGFDPVRFRADQRRIAAGELSEKSALVRAPLTPVTGVTSLAVAGPERDRLRAIGEAALRRGEVAVVVLNGGMATRFGGVVKGTVEVFGGKSFLELKAEDVARASKTFGAAIPLVLMNSFQTSAATMEHVRATNNLGLGPAPRGQILDFDQSISVRMNPDGSLFIGDDEKPSYHAPGHGDFFSSIRRSGVLDELRARGVKTISFSNVDNLGATIDPVVIGHHLSAGATMTAELAEKRRTASGKWDAGASPVMLDGRAQLVEGFRLPADLSPIDYPDLSTNNFVFSVDALDRDVPLERYVVKKNVDGSPVLQLESITCEASGVRGGDGEPMFQLQLLRAPRDGEGGRFFPIKEPPDLEANRELLRGRLYAGWRERDGAA